jgi:hypothetical protein
MPFLEFECPQGHVVEYFCRSISEGERLTQVVCGECMTDPPTMAKKIISMPLPAHLYGDPQGWSRPSPTKRHSTKLVSKKTGNESAVG